MNKWLSLIEAAKEAEVARSTMHDALARGELPFVVTSLGRLIAREDVEAWAASRRRQKQHQEVVR